jgi:FKBP-type peptidyl-prolyl cis-trans isomerase
MYGAALMCAAAVTLAGCADGGSGNALLESDEQKASYGIGRDVGRNLGQNLGPAWETLDMDAFVRGVEEQLAGEDAALPQEEIRAALQRYMETVQQARQAKAEEAQAAGEEFLAENAGKEGVETTDSGLQWEVVEEGDGPQPGPTDEVTIHYEGKLLDGTVFDSSRERGEPATFPVARVIPGFSEGLQLMHRGGTYRLFIPSDLAYGEQGAQGGPIGPNETLIFDVELLQIGGDDEAGDAPAGGDASEGGDRP